MPQSCTICRHLKREEIDRALLAGEPFRHIAARFGTSTSALVRHKANDIPVALSKAHEAAEVDYGDDLFGHVKDLNRRTLAILKQAEVSGDPRIALAAIREARSNTELLCRMLVAAEANKPPDSSAESVQEIVDKLKLLSLSEDGPPALTDGTTCDQSNGSTAEFDLKPGESHEEWVQRMVDLSIRSGENREG